MLAVSVLTVVEKYPQHSRMLGEIDMMKSNLVSLEKDMEDFKDVVAKYRSQLIKVKVSFYHRFPLI